MDLGEIKQKIAEDKSKTIISYRRYPVRFLFLELNKETQNEILDLVKSGNGELLDLSDFVMKKDDGWLTKSRFIQVIKNNVSNQKDTYVVGFSEMIRFYSRKEIESTVLSLYDIENSDITNPDSSSRRIYFICFSMMDNVQKVLQNSFSRKDLIDPFINADCALNVTNRQLCFVSDEYSDNITSNKVTTSVEWIGLWRHSEIIDFDKPIWCCSASLYDWHQKASPDNAFHIDVIGNTKEYLQKVYGKDIDFVYREEEDSFWKSLLESFEIMGDDTSIKDLVSKILGIDINESSSLAGKYISSDKMYEKWLIKNYVFSYRQETFLYRVLSNPSLLSNKEFVSAIWKQGYRISNSSMLKERMQILCELTKYATSHIPEEEISEEVDSVAKEYICSSFSIKDLTTGGIIEYSKQTGQTIEEINSRILSFYTKVLKPSYTGISNTEKESCINLYSVGIIDRSELKSIYPLLHSYLFASSESIISEREECKAYLDAYRNSKIRNSDVPFLKNYYESGEANVTKLYDLYYGLEKQDVLIQGKKDDNTDIYIIDGVGAEYIPLIIELLRINSYKIESCDYASAHLPTITDVNKTYLSSIGYKKWITDFDRNVIHGDYYKAASNIRKSIDYLEQIIKDIVAESYGKRIIISSDHGSTARAKWVNTEKKYNFAEADHEGRCCKIKSKSDYKNTDDYIVYEDELDSDNTYVISINSTSLYTRPKYEDHGGATIEELLVPVIVALPVDMAESINYKVYDNKLSVSGLDKRVEFVIVPEPSKAYVYEADDTKHNLIKSNGIFYADLNAGKEQNITVIVDDKEYHFRTVNKSKKNMEGDDGFDD